jgi:hypothetical protein
MRLACLVPALVLVTVVAGAETGEDASCTSSVAASPPVKKTSVEARQRALEKAGLGDPGAEGPLLEALAQAQDGREREQIVHALGKIATDRSLPALLDLVGERGLTGPVEAALVRIDPQWRRRPEIEGTVARLATSLSTLPEPVVKPAVCASAPPLDQRGDAAESAEDEQEDEAAQAAHLAALSDFYRNDPCEKAEWAEQEMCWDRAARISVLATLDRSRAADAAELLFDAGRCLSERGLLVLLAREGRLDVATTLDSLLAGGGSPLLLVEDVTQALDMADPSWREGPDAKRAAQTLIERLSSDSAEDREKAAQLMADLRLSGGAAVLIRMLEDVSRPDNERMSAARALDSQTGPARDALVRCAELGSGPVQATCADVLIGSGAAEGLRVVRRLLTSPDAGERRAGLGELSSLPTPLDPDVRAMAARVCFDIVQAGGNDRYSALASLEHLASPETLPQARELFARWGDLEYGRSTAVLVLLESGGADELPRVLDVAREDPNAIPEVAVALAKLDWVPTSAFDEMLDLLRAREASPTPKPGEEPAEAAGWQASYTLDAIVGRLMANPEQVGIENLRWLAHHPEARIRAQARYAAFRAGINVDPSPRR